MTATPLFYPPHLRREAGLLDVEVASMDDESVFGTVLHRLTFGEAIERELLSDYQVVVAVNNEMYRAWAERGEFVTPDGEKVTDARTLGRANRCREGDAQVQPAPRHLVPQPRQRGAQVQRGPAVCERVDARTRPTTASDMERARFRRNVQRSPRQRAAALPRFQSPRITPKRRLV
jgi:hypothetical protein